MRRVLLPVLLSFTLCACTSGTQKLKGSELEYQTVTLQVQDKLFYDVRVPTNAVLESTDGVSYYSFDLLHVGVQDLEPATDCKVKVGNRWVFAESKDNWLRPTMIGFEILSPYQGGYSTEHTEWNAKLPSVTMPLDTEVYTRLKARSSLPFGGDEFITAQDMYRTYEETVDYALRRMSTVFEQPLITGAYTDGYLWIESSDYVVAVIPVNYNTCTLVTGHGERAVQYAAALVQEGVS